MIIMLIIDGKDKLLGRLATQVAKLLLKGEEVAIINAEEIKISGHKEDLVAMYKQRLELKNKVNPEHSPYWSRRPDLLVKRSIRGMLPKHAKGREAYKRLKVYIGMPKELEGKEIYNLNTKTYDKVFEDTISMKELAKELGWSYE